ncbi:MAG: NADAR family protein [Pseudomonadota bacterium]
MTIYFYGQTDAYSEFSNFAPFGIEMDGVWWPTVEHYFQAQKFEDAAYREKIRRADRPKEAKALGLTRKLPIRSDWEAVKVEVMQAAVRQQFATHPALRALLLNTGAEEIVENAPHDYFWGGGQDGTGRNTLGKILMEVRDSLRAVGAPAL